jgi:preprotein translocase subunit SecA
MIQGILKKIFGDKSTNDRKTYQPIIDKTLEFQEAFQQLSDNDLRAKTAAFQELIRNEISPIEKEIETLKEKANNPETLVLDKEAIFDKIDKLSKESDEKIEEVLEKILPEAFATIKETARRWSENGQLIVEALQFDKDLAAKKDGITIDGQINGLLQELK